MNHVIDNNTESLLFQLLHAHDTKFMELMGGELLKNMMITDQQYVFFTVFISCNTKRGMEIIYSNYFIPDFL